MKITKNQLKQIIKEEITNVSESDEPYGNSSAYKVRQALLDAHSEIARQLEAEGLSADEAEESAVNQVFGYVNDYLKAHARSAQLSAGSEPSRHVNKNAYAWDFVKRSMPSDNPEIDKKLKNPFLENKK